MEDLALNIFVSKEKANSKKSVKKKSNLKSTNISVKAPNKQIGSLPSKSLINRTSDKPFHLGKHKKPLFTESKSGFRFGSKPFSFAEKFAKTEKVTRNEERTSTDNNDTAEKFTVTFVKPKLFQKKSSARKKPDSDTSKSEKYDRIQNEDVHKKGNNEFRVEKESVVNKSDSMVPFQKSHNFPLKSTTHEKKHDEGSFLIGERASKWFVGENNLKSRKIHVQFPNEVPKSNIRPNAKPVSFDDSPEHFNFGRSNKRVLEDVHKSDEVKIVAKRRKFDKDVREIKKSKSVGPISSLFNSSPVVEMLDEPEVEPVEEKLFSGKSFVDVGVHSHLVGNLQQLFGITNMTVVQKKTIPVLMLGKDALVRSQTGSGKTLAYAIPIMDTLQKITPKLSRKDGVKALIVLPTRELALQTYECFVKLMRAFTWIVPGLVIGGEKKKSEKVRLRKGINVLIGTPGRLLDHAQNTGNLKLNGIDWLIIDEADRLLDMGYEKDISSLISIINEQREGADSVGRKQTVLLSATLTSEVERLANLTLNDPEHVDACDDAHESADVLIIPKSLEQKYVVVPAKVRLVALAAFMIDTAQLKNSNKVLVFMATQDMVDFYSELIPSVLSASYKCFKLHGSMSQGDRTEVFNAFRKSDKGVLLSTDVAARGLDLPKVDWIVQYTAPTTPAEYVHRVGRTARVGSTGSSLLFLLPSELHFVSMLNSSRVKLVEVPLQSYLKCLMKIHLESMDGQRWGGGVEGAATVLQHNFEHALINDDSLHSLACKAYKSWVRFYATYPKDSRIVFNFKSLHLGHNAKSFALRDPPKAIGGYEKPKKGSKLPAKRGKNLSKRNVETKRVKVDWSTKKLLMSEFDSGLAPIKKAK